MFTLLVPSTYIIMLKIIKNIRSYNLQIESFSYKVAVFHIYHFIISGRTNKIIHSLVIEAVVILLHSAAVTCDGATVIFIVYKYFLPSV